MGDPIRHAVFMILALSLFWESESYNLVSPSTLDNITLARFKRQNPDEACFGDASKFQCADGENCVDIDLKCDGNKECPDGSDETEKTCKDYFCYDYLFKCAYGACISPTDRCDGKKNCWDNSDEDGCDDKKLNQTKPNNYCRSDQFQCENGECIELHQKCDGITECSDNSDETEALCLNIFCPGFTYKCKYGACVDGNSECNGVRDCFDNSDEDETKCKSKVPPIQNPKSKFFFPESDEMCITPPQPKYGNWIDPHTKESSPNIRVNSGTTIVFSCQNNYKLSTTNDDELSVTCRSNGTWGVSLPECEKLCPSIDSDGHTQVVCRNQADSVVPCNKATHLTWLRVTCSSSYFEPAPGLNSLIIYCYSGTWEKKPKCVPACGRKRVDDETIMIINGTTVKPGDYPWSVALYKTDSDNSNLHSKYTHICGGSLLSTNVVLTAAHCVTVTDSGEPIRTDVFQVSAGNYYSKFEDWEDENAQFSEIETIKFRTDYGGGNRHFRDDIALLKLKTNLVLSQVVQPVCFLGLDELPPLKPNDTGLVIGWGFTETNGKPSETLKEVELPYIDYQQCKNQLDKDFAKEHLFSSTICAGRLNNNAGICHGDSGSGLVFRHNDRYYVRGITSLSEKFRKNQEAHCNVKRPALFTNVHTYYQWIRGIMLKWSSDV